VLSGDGNSEGGRCAVCQLAVRCVPPGGICKIVGLGMAWRSALVLPSDA